MSPTSPIRGLNNESLPHSQLAEPSGTTGSTYQDNANEIDEQNATNATIIPITIHASNENDQNLEPDFLPEGTYDCEIDIEDGQNSISLLTIPVGESHENVLPTYKEQMTETTRGSLDQQCTMSTSKENCDSTVPQKAELYENSDQSTIPVAEARVIQDESITMNTIHIVEMHTETAHVQSLSTLNSSQEENLGEIASCEKSGQTGSISDDESDSYDKLKQIAFAAIRVERKFWIRLIIIALFLNSILVAGVVVGILCGTGACPSSFYHDTSAPTQFPSPSPSLSPSRTLSERPPKEEITTVDSDPEEDVYGTPIPTAVLVSSSPSLSTEISPSLAADRSPPLSTESTGSPTLAANGTVVLHPPVQIEMPSSKQDDDSKFEKPMSSSTITNITVSAIFAELLIIVTLILYYRRWKYM